MDEEQERILFELVDGDNILERDIRRMASLSESQAIIIQEHYRDARERLIDSMADWAHSDRFTEARLASTLDHVDREILALDLITDRESEMATSIGVDQAETDAWGELNHLEKKFKGSHGPYPREEVEISLEKSNYLVNNFRTSIKAYNQSERARMQKILSAGITERKTNGQVTDEIANDLPLQDWKIRRIVRTEMSNIYSSAKILSFRRAKERAAPDLMKAVYNPIDQRTGDDSKRFEKMKQVIPLDDYFEYRWDGKTRKFFAPPDRPNDRGVLIPVRETWV